MSGFSEQPSFSAPNPENTPEKMREKLLDPYFLPTQTEINFAFPNRSREYSNKEAFNSFWYNAPYRQYEIITVEFIEKLSQYLLSEFSSNEETTVILEAGAGSGKLSYFLQKKLLETGSSIKILACDKAREERDEGKRLPHVEDIDYREALKKYQPTVVISSWMPYAEDWTANFRATPSVKEYLLVGEMNGASGDHWQTWGEESTWFYEHEDEPLPEQTPFQADGFEMTELEDISAVQMNYNDRDGYRSSQSHTVSFKKSNI